VVWLAWQPEFAIRGVMEGEGGAYAVIRLGPGALLHRGGTIRCCRTARMIGRAKSMPASAQRKGGGSAQRGMNDKLT
jgi:hypothetical protein